jgi:hypothetical protein
MVLTSKLVLQDEFRMEKGVFAKSPEECNIILHKFGSSVG